MSKANNIAALEREIREVMIALDYVGRISKRDLIKRIKAMQRELEELKGEKA